MTLLNEIAINYNLNHIRRIMKKYNLVYPHRKASPYRRMMKATKEHTVLPNLLNRDFKQGVPRKVLLTDISYLFFKCPKAYLSTILHASTNEILACNVSRSLKIAIVTDTIDILLKSNKIQFNKDPLFTQIKEFIIQAPFFNKDLPKSK